MSVSQRTRIAAALPACFALAWGVPVQAQMLEEVIVTATKREVGMQDVPIALAVGSRKCLDPQRDLWQRVLEATGQPISMVGR